MDGAEGSWIRDLIGVVAAAGAVFAACGALVTAWYQRQAARRERERRQPAFELAARKGDNFSSVVFTLSTSNYDSRPIRIDRLEIASADYAFLWPGKDRLNVTSTLRPKTAPVAPGSTDSIEFRVHNQLAQTDEWRPFPLHIYLHEGPPDVRVGPHVKRFVFEWTKEVKLDSEGRS